MIIWEKNIKEYKKAKYLFVNRDCTKFVVGFPRPLPM